MTDTESPDKFAAPWNEWEFAFHILDKKANLVIISMAWLTYGEVETSKEPDIETLSFWVARLEPLIRAEMDGEIIVVLANRCGSEGDAVYAGSSAVLGIHNGEVKVYGILGRGDRALLVVDTNAEPQAKLVATSKLTPANTNVAIKVMKISSDTSVSARFDMSSLYVSPRPSTT